MSANRISQDSSYGSALGPKQGNLWTDGRRQSLSIRVGEVGRISARDARAKAKMLLGSIADGIDSRPKPVPAQRDNNNNPTVAQARERYRDVHMRRKGRSEKTVQGYRDHVERLMGDWLRLPISMLGRQPELVRAHHDKLTREHEPYMANATMRSLRAIYNHARKTMPGLPANNPVIAVDWNAEKRRDTGWGSPTCLHGCYNCIGWKIQFGENFTCSSCLVAVVQTR